MSARIVTLVAHCHPLRSDRNPNESEVRP